MIGFLLGLLIGLVAVAIGTAMLAGLAYGPVWALCKMRVVRREWQAAIVQAGLMLIFPVLLIVYAERQNQQCLATVTMCDDPIGPMIEMFSSVVVLGSLIVGLVVGARIFRDVSKRIASGPE